MKPMRFLCAVAVASMALAGCGGGDDGDAGAGGLNAPGASGQVPASAAASPNALVRFLKGLATTEVGEPLQVGAFEPPRAEQAEPETLE
jgi:hypothetical protein